ncbi:hypothetical protein SNE40_011582 [Patella caerulea]|uniref:Uncharacterized protein n=1 Tax=Patella caerulea TaxID=87958 RepID=A0AAN8JK42_PATCE
MPSKHISTSTSNSSSSTFISEASQEDFELLIAKQNSAKDNTSKRNTEDNTSHFLSDIEQDLNTEQATDPPVTDKLASIIDKRCAGKMTDEKLKDKMGKYICPENIKNLSAPLVNMEIWQKLNTFNRKQDIRMTNIQKTIQKAAIAITNTTEKLLKSDNLEGNKKAIEMLTDALALCGHANYDMSLRRRELIRSALNPEFRSICSNQVPVTNLLFGPDLPKLMRDIKESNHIGQNLNKRKREDNYGQFGHQHPGIHRKSFLGKRQWTPRAPPPKSYRHQGKPYNNRKKIDK